MKKQFFYAAFAIAMMASCSNEDNPLVEQPATPDDDRVAIELGVDAPTVTASSRASRGTGSVGDTEASGQNNWDGQQLYITMIDRATGAVATDGGSTVLDYNTQKFYAPTTGSEGLIKFMDSNTAGKQNYVYYPVSGTYDFYGWHLDDAATGASVVTTPQGTNPNIAISNIVINGTQDIMGAKTKPAEELTNWTSTLADWAFSARTARAKVTPVLTFDHQLARLKFYVRAGSHKTAKTGENSTPNKVTLDANKAEAQTGTEHSTAMYVTSLVAQQLHTTLSMTLNHVGITTTADASAKGNFTLGSIVEQAIDGTDDTPAYAVGDVGPLVATAPEKLYDDQDPSYKGDQVGESIMFLPVEGSTEDAIDFKLNLKQLVPMSETGGVKTYGEKTQETMLKVLASSIVGGTGTKKFEAGSSYNIYITIYGFEQIEVSAELTAWDEGGDVDVDIEEGISKHETKVTFNVYGSDTPTTALTGATYKYYLVDGNTETEITEQTTNVLKVQSYSTVKYVISADGYDTATGYINAGKNDTRNITVTLQKTVVVTPTNSNINFEITLPDGKTEATITIEGSSETLTYSESNKTLVLPYGTEAKTINIKVDGYQNLQKTVTPNAENVEVNVASTEFVAEIVKYTVTITAPENAEIWIGSEQKSSVEVEAGSSVTYTVKLSGYQDYTQTISNVQEAETINVTVEQLTKLVKITGKAVSVAGGEVLQDATITLTAEGYQANTDGSITVPVGTKVAWTVVVTETNTTTTYKSEIETTGYTEDKEVELVCDEDSKQS